MKSELMKLNYSSLYGSCEYRLTSDSSLRTTERQCSYKKAESMYLQYINNKN